MKNHENQRGEEGGGKETVTLLKKKDYHKHIPDESSVSYFATKIN